MIDSRTVRAAYEQGVFPMADESGEIGWYAPYHRALFPITGIHVSRSLSKVIRRDTFEIRFDTSYEAVMRGCLRPTDNWITEEIIETYCAIHAEGWGHCAECWHKGDLVGGVYGIAIGGCFSAESMFHRTTNASKIALWAMVERCRDLGFDLFDAQIMNPHLRSLGAFHIPQREYLRLLQKVMHKETPWSGRYETN